MSYKELNISKHYETTSNRTQLLEDFYIPFLKETKKYDRIAGFFSSSSLIVASEGIEELINNDGKMRLLISPKLSQQDYDVIKYNNKLCDTLSIFDEINRGDFPKNDNLEALAWMLRNGSLEIKIAVTKNVENSMLHEKIGIGTDKEGNMISFSGSINETAQAWLSNIEEFKTFKSWEPEQLEYLLVDLKKFNNYWNNEKKDIADVYDIPDSIKNKIIDISPRDINDLSIMKKYHKYSSSVESSENFWNKLFKHQQEAVSMWQGNNYSLLMEMATGTGKTRTAIGCFMSIKNKVDKLVVIVATPQNTLSRQWKKDVEEDLHINFDKSIVTSAKWRKDIEELLLDIKLGYANDGIIYTTHDLASSKDFTELMNNYKDSLNLLFICDEVHGIGSDIQRQALLEAYKYRIGLSATPERMFDETGTSLIRKYFGNKSFEFTIKDALETLNPCTGYPFLNKFYYKPVFVYLNEEELEQFKNYSRKIAIIESQEDYDKATLEGLFNNRARILKNAEEKLNTVESIIDKLNTDDKIKDTIIFATDKQIEPVLNMLSQKGIVRSKVTDDESTSKVIGIRGNTEREENIDQFRRGNIQVLVGMKCLDEGIDIKNARIAIIMASSTNPREYVQRVGRVIRVAPNKSESIIYDLVVTTSSDDAANNKILEKEAKRTKLIACNAINYDEVKEIFLKNGVDLDGC